ncbi:MAG: LysM peptidoglycan-binding domain-containing protein [Acidimicrobiales bacterium]
MVAIVDVRPPKQPAPAIGEIVRWRHLAAAASALLAVLALTGVAVDRAGQPTAGSAQETVVAGGDGPAAPSGVTTYVVQSGDTVWSIAEALDRGGDVRAVVDRIVAANGGAALVPGQRLVVEVP